jgi:DNA-binding phage protein
MSNAPIGRSFDEVVQARVRQEPEFGEVLLQEAVQMMLAGELDVARSLIRDVIKGSIGYAELSRCTGTPEKSLVRMFGPNGNPTAANMFSVLAQLQRHSGVSLQVQAVPIARKRSGKPRSTSARRAASA